jgi:hypothetical protein
MTKSTCPRCGAVFNCNHERLEECHCITVPLDARQIEYIGQHYDSCLCHTCLTDIADGFYAASINPKFSKIQVSIF